MDNNDTNNDNNNRLLDKLLVEKYSLFKEMKIIDIIEKLEREKKQNKLIIKTAFNLFSSKKITNLIKEIVDSIYELLPAETIAVFTNLDPTEPYFEAKVYESYREKVLPDIPIIELLNNSKLIKYLSNYKLPIFYDVLIQKLPDLSDNNPFKDLNIFLIVPMISHDKLNGFICLGKPIIKNTYTKEELDFLHHIAFFSSLAVNNINLNRLIVLDRKTSLYSHYYFYENLEIECNKSLRYNTALSLIMCDLDDFKQINDSYGHMAGDMVIRTFSTLIKHSIRNVDLPARFGGEEFTIILPMTTSEGSYIVAERIRKKLENYAFKFKGEQFKVTVSMGIASLYDDIEINSADKLIEASDRALYKSKHSGKNKTSFYIDYFLE